MKLNRSLLIGAVVVLLGNVVALLIGVPSWALALANPVMLLLAGLTIVRTEDRLPDSSSPSVEQSREVDDTALSPVSSSTLVRGIRLPSTDPDYNYLFSAKVHWISHTAGSASDDLAGLAVASLLRRARTAAADCAPSTDAPVEHLTTLLAFAEFDERRQIKVWASDVHLAVPTEQTDEVQRLLKLRREQETIDREYQLRRDRSRFFRDEVLASPGTATAWWLAAHPEELERCAELYPTFSRLSAMANDRLENSDSTLRWISDYTDDGPTARAAFDFATSTDAGPDRTGSPDAGSTVQRVSDFESAVAFLLDGHTPSEKLLKAAYIAGLETTFKRLDRAEQIREQFNVDALPTLPALRVPASEEPPVAADPPTGTASGSESLNGATARQDALAAQTEAAESTGDSAHSDLPRDPESSPESESAPRGFAQIKPQPEQSPEVDPQPPADGEPLAEPEPPAGEKAANHAPVPPASSGSPASQPHTGSAVSQPHAEAHDAQPVSESDQSPNGTQSAEVSSDDGGRATARPVSNWPIPQPPAAAPAVTEYREHFPD